MGLDTCLHMSMTMYADVFIHTCLQICSVEVCKILQTDIHHIHSHVSSNDSLYVHSVNNTFTNVANHLTFSTSPISDVFSSSCTLSILPTKWPKWSQIHQVWSELPYKWDIKSRMCHTSESLLLSYDTQVSLSLPWIYGCTYFSMPWIQCLFNYSLL